MKCLQSDAAAAAAAVRRIQSNSTFSRYIEENARPPRVPCWRCAIAIRGPRRTAHDVTKSKSNDWRSACRALATRSHVERAHDPGLFSQARDPIVAALASSYPFSLSLYSLYTIRYYSGDGIMRNAQGSIISSSLSADLFIRDSSLLPAAMLIDRVAVSRRRLSIGRCLYEFRSYENELHLMDGFDAIARGSRYRVQ